MIWGALFGFAFPIVATILAVTAEPGPVSPAKVLELHRTNPLLLIIDLAPLVLGIFSYFLGQTSEKGLMVQRQRRKDAEKYLYTLESQNKELTELNNALDSLLYTASHDLKTPIVNFRSLSYMLRQLISTGADPEMVLQAMDRLDQSTDKMENIIADLLNLSRVEAHFDEGYSLISLKDAVSKCTESVEGEIKRKQIQINTDFSAAEKLMFPPQSLESILNNLIGNAIKYSSPERPPQVNIFTKRTDDNIVLNIQDNGIGIDLERHREKLFQMFKRLNNQSGGSGLGLYIVKRIVDKSGGSIEVQSEPGKGTLFSLSIPQPKLT